MEPQTQPAQAAERKVEFDVIRGLMIALVVFGHTTHRGSAAALLGTVVGWVYSFHMPIFFFISGYLFAPRGSLGTALKSQLFRLGKPYLLFQVVYVVGLYLAHEHGLPVMNSVDAISLSSLTYVVVLKPIGAYWFLHALLIYNLSWLAARWLEKLGVPLAVGLLGLLAVVVLSPVTLREDAAFFLVAGFTWRSVGRSLPQSHLGWIAIGALALGSDGFAIRQDLFLWGTWTLCVFTVLMASSRTIAGSGLARHLAFLGSNSLVILLLHAFALSACKPLAAPILAVEPSGFAFSIASTAAGVYLPVAAGWISDRIGTSRFAFGRTPITVLPRSTS